MMVQVTRTVRVDIAERYAHSALVWADMHKRVTLYNGCVLTGRRVRVFFPHTVTLDTAI